MVTITVTITVTVRSGQSRLVTETVSGNIGKIGGNDKMSVTAVSVM
jgi:ribosomal protein L2